MRQFSYTRFIIIFTLLSLNARADPPQQQNAPTPPASTAPASVNAYVWQDVPHDVHVPVQQAWLDQQGYRLQADNGETISVPFVNDDMNVMKFARSTTPQTYFVNEQNEYPVLYLANDGYVASSAAANARWQPISQEFNQSSPPVYVDPAPDWDSFRAMGWYPNMTINGGFFGPNTGVPFSWMPGSYVFVGGTYYRSWGAFRSYSIQTPGNVQSRAVKVVSISRSTSPWPGLNQRSNSGNSSASLVHPLTPTGMPGGRVAITPGESITRREPAQSGGSGATRTGNPPRSQNPPPPVVRSSPPPPPEWYGPPAPKRNSPTPQRGKKSPPRR